MKPQSILYVGVNSLGWFLYIAFLKHIRRQMHAEERTDGDFGDSLYLLFTAVPLLLCFLVVNIVWGVLALNQIFPCRERSAKITWAGVVTTWTTVYLVMRYLP